MYYFNEGSIRVPKEWNDQTIHILTSSKEKTSGLSFTIAKDKMPWGMDFSEFAEKEISALARQLTNYKQLNRDHLIIADKDAVMSEFSWDSSQGHIHQLITFLHTRPHILIFTVSMPDLLSAKQKEQMLDMLHTLKLRD